MATFLMMRCQKRACAHRRCPPQGCSQTCRNLSWCQQCTRFWCEECWGDVDAHQPLTVELPGMTVHEKAMQMVFNTYRATQEVGAAPPPTPTSQTNQNTVDRHQTDRSELSPPASGSQRQHLQENAQTKSTPRQQTVLQPPGSRRLFEDHAAPRLGDRENYQLRLMDLENLNRVRLLAARRDLDLAAQKPTA